MSRNSYTLRFDRPLDREVVRLVRSQTNRARRELKSPSDGAVHAARKALKRARAVLRLVRGVLPHERYKQFDHDLRNLGRHLSAVRDAVVALELVEALGKEEVLAESMIVRLRDGLRTVHADAWQALDDELIAAIRAELDTLRLRPEELSGLDARAFYDGLAWTYRRGRKRLARAMESPSADTLHTWRRQVKHLGYQHRLIAPAWPLVLRPAARAFDALGEALGDEHDLAELNRAATLAGLDTKALRTLERRTSERRALIHERIWPLGVRVYAEPDHDFAERMTVYIASAIAEAQGESQPVLSEAPHPLSPQRSLVQVTG